MPPRLPSPLLSLRPLRISRPPYYLLHFPIRYHATSPPPRFPLLNRLLRPISALLTLLTIPMALALTNNHLFSIMPVHGPSMSPYLNSAHNTTLTRDHLLLSMHRPSSNLRRGMLIAFWSPFHPEKLAIKRVVALEGDRVVTKKPYEVAVVDVPVGHVWVEGDFGEMGGRTLDSNYYGPVSRSLIVGRAVGVVWPWERRGWVRWEDWRGNGRVVEGANKVEKVVFH